MMLRNLNSPITEDSAVFTIDPLVIMHIANDNQLTARPAGWSTRLRHMSPALAFTIGFSAAGLIVALETTLLFG